MEKKSFCCMAVIHIQLYTYTCGNKINNNDERTHFFRKIYLSNFIRNDKDGRRPDPERATAIKDMPAPDNITTLQSFLGLANYYQSFMKNLHDFYAPINELLKKDFKKWRWMPECQTAFDQIKKALTSNLFLTHYDQKLEIIFASDASLYGVGVCILHKMPDGTKKPIAHASRTLLPAKKYYSQIEKAALGILFAGTKFHRYIRGRFLTLQTDYKPLITIFGSKSVYQFILPIGYKDGERFYWTTILKSNTSRQNRLATQMDYQGWYRGIVNPSRTQ